MHTRTLLADRIARDQLCPGAGTLDAWLDTSWIKFRLGRWLVPVIPLWGLKKALVAHDAHHAVLDYPITLRGELALAGWELASGGCGWNLPFWIDRTIATMLGFVFCPGATWRATKRGWRQRNLYGMSIDGVLSSDVEELRRRMKIGY